MLSMSDALRLAALIIFLVSLVVTARRHAAQLGGRRMNGFFAYLGNAGWLILTLASGVTAFRPGLWILGASTAAVGVLCILTAAVMRVYGRA